MLLSPREYSVEHMKTLKCLIQICHSFLSQNSNNPVYRRIYQHMERQKSFVSNMEQGIRRTQEGNFAFIGEAVSLDLTVARYCKLTRSQEVIAMRSYSIAAPLGESLGKSGKACCFCMALNANHSPVTL